ncbi:hypothetical protein ACFY7C_19220 [Streptomyces sp. NPDC012769]|uniref:hypothetical protein n=1 Tax=Streptomyces sp. NPDC012769 TaxID=3364848 RepID=UPI0036CC1FFE
MATTTFYRDPTAVQAAQRMAARGSAGDPACSMSYAGQFDESDVPARAQGKRVGVGTAGGYVCLIF